MTLEQAVSRRLSDIVALAESGVTEMTGHARREYPGGSFVGLNLPELQSAGISPKVAAAAIRRGSG